MDQKDLRRIEDQCIQEQPPECVGTCPLHVDVRSFMGHLSQGRWKEALGVLRKTMPFPSLLGRICDAPCRERCPRSGLGGSLRVHDLERAVVTRAGDIPRVTVPPRRPARVAVVGDGLGGLTVAWDLARKGYPVTIITAQGRPGQGLLDRFSHLLGLEVLERELAVLDRLGVEFRPEVLPALDALLDEPGWDFQAVFLDLAVVDPGPWNFEASPDGRIQVDALLRTTSRKGVFAGGGATSTILQAAEGRFGATTIDRWLQKVSLTAGREKDGPISTRLFTPLEGVQPIDEIQPSDPPGGYTEDEAIREAGRCLLCECRACVKVCPYLERFGSYPKKYAREIYNNESMVVGVRQANTMIDSCSLCGLCTEVCPEKFSMASLCLEARQSMVRRGKMPPSAHEFALDDMAFSQGESFALARNAPGTVESAWVLYPGCQLAATSHDQVDQLYAHLREKLSGGVGLILGCCGVPAHWSGREDLFAEALGRTRSQWETLGRPRVITACATCYRMFRDHLPEVTTVSLWWVLDELAPPQARLRPVAAALHDPCTTRHEPGVQDSVRKLLARAGIRIDELALSRDRTECCGFGGLMENANPELARETIRRRAGQSSLDYLAYCAMCRDALAGVGKRVMHVLDIFFPPSEVDDPADRARPDLTTSKENRARLRERLLQDIWGDSLADEPAEHEQIRLILSPEMQKRLDDHRILRSDVQKVIRHAETTGDRLRHPGTGHYLAAFRPIRVTFWVEYTPGPDGFEIYDAYSHRMEVAGGGRL